MFESMTMAEFKESDENGAILNLIRSAHAEYAAAADAVEEVGLHLATEFAAAGEAAETAGEKPAKPHGKGGKGGKGRGNGTKKSKK
jgi:hypothetical protein